MEPLTIYIIGRDDEIIGKFKMNPKGSAFWQNVEKREVTEVRIMNGSWTIKTEIYPT